MRSMGFMKEPKRSYLYKGNRYPFYYWPTHSTESGKLYTNPEEMLQSVSFWKQVDRLNKIKLN
jgi:hypothetical protein